MKKYTWFDILQWVIAALAFIGMVAIYVMVFWEKIKARIDIFLDDIRWHKYYRGGKEPKE